MEQMFFPVTRREAERSGTQYSPEKNKNAGFPSRLRELRKEKGVSQDVVSRELGVSKSTLGLWETGDTLPDAKAIYRLSDYFEVSTDYIMGKTSVKTADADLKSVCDYTGLSEQAIKNVCLFCDGLNRTVFSPALFVSELLESPDLYRAMSFTFGAIETAVRKKHNPYSAIEQKDEQAQEVQLFLKESKKFISESSKTLDKLGMAVFTAEQAEEYSLMKAKEYINEVITTIFENMVCNAREHLEAKIKEAENRPRRC